MYNIVIALIVAIPGYLLYKKGFLGGGDFHSSIAFSLLLILADIVLLLRVGGVEERTGKRHA